MKAHSVTKKSKEKKDIDVWRIKEYAKEFELLIIIMNKNIPNTVLKRIREDFGHRAKMLFVKKKMATAKYNMPTTPKEQFFLVFVNGDSVEKVKTYKYYDFLKAGDICPVDAIVERQGVKSKEIAELLSIKTENGKTQLTEDLVVVEAGGIVNPTEEKILRFFGKKLKEQTFNIFSITNTTGLLSTKK